MRPYDFAVGGRAVEQGEGGFGWTQGATPGPRTIRGPIDWDGGKSGPAPFDHLAADVAFEVGDRRWRLDDDGQWVPDDAEDRPGAPRHRSTPSTRSEK
jgi:hypothetical protein